MIRRSRRALHIAALLSLALIGTACGIYVLLHQSGGVRPPWEKTYRVDAEIAAANGVLPSVGQPVNVAGVQVGHIVGVHPNTTGNAVVELEIEQNLLPAVRADARATLVPLSPLKDLSIELDPGRPSKRALRDGGTIPIARTASPVELSTLLQSLDTDTRMALTAFVGSVGDGVTGQGEAMRRALAALGPTTHQARLVSHALAARDKQLARLVSNVATVSAAAARDGRLAGLVSAGNATLEAVARQDAALGASLKRLPPTLRSTQAALDTAATFAKELAPTAAALAPALSKLPGTMSQVRTVAEDTRRAVANVRPFVRSARPVARDLAVAVPAINRLSPQATHGLQMLTYLLNVLAYNPPARDDEGGLFWMSWFFHNWGSVVSMADAHGQLMRGLPFVTCSDLSAATPVATLVIAAFGLGDICPN